MTPFNSAFPTMGVKLSRVDIDVYYLLCWVAVSIACTGVGGARKEGLDDLDDGLCWKNRAFQPRPNRWKWPHVFLGCVAILFVASFMP